MDWIDEKIEKIRDKIRNLPIRKALPAYLCIFALAGFLLTVITVGICGKWQDILYEKSSEIQVVYTANGERVFGYTQDFLSLSTSRKAAVMILTAVQNWCPYVYAVVSMFITAVLFYRRRLKKPFDILEEGMRNIKEKNLEFKMEYNSRDEMGRLCEAFEEMRGHLVENQKEMWRLVEEQKKLNAAFAHDLRTPLTVIRGYSDFLVKYIPQRNISQEKLKDTLRLLSAQAERLEKFSQTMKDARSVDDIPFHPEKTDCAYLDKKIRGMGKVSRILGPGSSYTKDRIKDNGMVEKTYEDALAEYEDLMEKDGFTGGYARMFCDYMGIILGILPVFVTATRECCATNVLESGN